MRNRLVAVGLVTLLLSSCTKGPSQTGVEPTGHPTDLASAKAAWEHAAIDSYTLVVTVTGCMACGGPDPYRTATTVTDGQVTDRSVPLGMKPRGAPVVEDLFRWIDFAGPDRVQEIRYNDVGVPIEMHIDNPHVSDDQGNFKISFETT